MSTTRHERYPTLTDRERQVLINKILYNHKLRCMRQRFLHKETRLHGKRMVAKRVLLYKRSIGPLGEPMFCRPSPWRCVIKVSDIAYLLRICDRYAQEKLRELKIELKKDYVTVKEFCKAYMFEEEYIQRLLNDGDAREHNDPKYQRKIDALNRYYDEELKKIKEAQAKEREAEGTIVKKGQKKETPPPMTELQKKIQKVKYRRRSFDGSYYDEKLVFDKDDDHDNDE